MSVIVSLVDEVAERPEVATVTYSFFDTGALDIVRLADSLAEDVSSWSAPSGRPTTSESALALEARTHEDPEPLLPEIEIHDGLGL
jgi:hypothetical protein